MSTEFQRSTLSAVLRFEGPGLHSGVPVVMSVEPGDSGIQFHCGSESVAATPSQVTDTSRCTRLGAISTIEHLMSAFSAFGITDANVLLSAPELPAMNGSSQHYAEAIWTAGITALGTSSFSLFERVFLVDGDIRISVSKGTGRWRFDFETGDRWPGSQSYETSISGETFLHEIAGARTFAFEEEVARLRAAGLAKGLDETSALILGTSGYINDPKWPDEPARHKLLDLIGDLFLTGIPAQCLNVVAVRSGHRTNVEAAKKLAAHAPITPVERSS